MAEAETLDDIIKNIEEIVSLPVVVQEVISHTAEKKVTANSLQKIISKDPVLSSRIVKVANSSLFGFLSRTSDIKNAIVRLGLKQVRSIAVAMGVGLCYKGPKGLAGYSRVNVWEHSVSVGLMSELIAKNCRIREARDLAGEALLAGLMHDFGIIVMEQLMTKKFTQTIAFAASKNKDLNDAEKYSFDFDHTDVAETVFKKWKIPPRLVEAVAKHHEKPDRDNDILVHLAQMAEIMGSAAKTGFCDQKNVNKEHFQYLQDKLGLVGKPFMDIKNTYDKKIEEALKIFNVGEE